MSNSNNLISNVVNIVLTGACVVGFYRYAQEHDRKFGEENVGDEESVDQNPSKTSNRKEKNN